MMKSTLHKIQAIQTLLNMSLLGSCRTRSGNKQLRQVTCSVHQGRACHPCILCKEGNHSKYFHPKSWKDSNLVDILRKREPHINIEPDSCICRLCRDDVSKICDPDYVPRWNKAKKSDYTNCFIPGCNNSVHKVTKLVGKQSLCNFFGVVIANANSSDEESTALCLEHYGALYRHLNPLNRKCRTCDKTVNDATKTRKCPEPALIQQFLQQNTEFTGEISVEDRVCYACYKAHLVTIKHMHNTTTSTDADLASLIDKIKNEISSTSNIHTADQALLYAAHMSAVHVGEALLSQTALLLPDVFDYFHEKLREITKLCGIILTQEVNSTWLRSQLSSLLEQHMAYQCSVKKYGTVLYRFGGDLVHALNVSLGQARYQASDIPVMEKNDSVDFQATLSEACLALNAKCHVNIKRMIKEDEANPHQIEIIDVDKFITELDPDIWKAICLITQPLSPRAIKSANDMNVRNIRRFFCTCTLLFTTNPQCSFPLHTLIADAIETCGGSSRLMKLMNRLGVCASEDTHKRYIQYRVEKSMKQGPMFGYPSKAFTIASADNLDFIHSHARVYSGKQQLSWHGTTVQVVQPQPSKLVDTSKETQPTVEMEVLTHAETTQYSETEDSARRHPDTPAVRTLETRFQASLSKRSYSTRSPVSSPGKCSPLPKRLRRMRTGTEGTHIHDQLVSAHTPTQRNHQPQTQLQNPTLTIKDFLLTDEEDQAVKELKSMCTQYIFQKVANSDPNQTLINLQTYFSLSNNLPTPECSSVIYFKVLDLRCDDKQTLLTIISNLYEEFIVPGKKEWVLLEGDQATYKRLQCIKAEYGNDFAWMIPFPEDWHFLQNFQEVLVKVYFDAGLGDLAKASGYQPNSIGTNFKRTHKFLLETWESLYRHFLAPFLSNQAPPDFLHCAAEWLKSFPTSPNQEAHLET